MSSKPTQTGADDPAFTSRLLVHVRVHPPGIFIKKGVQIALVLRRVLSSKNLQVCLEIRSPQYPTPQFVLFKRLLPNELISTTYQLNPASLLQENLEVNDVYLQTIATHVIPHMTLYVWFHDNICTLRLTFRNWAARSSFWTELIK